MSEENKDKRDRCARCGAHRVRLHLTVERICYACDVTLKEEMASSDRPSSVTDVAVPR